MNRLQPFLAVTRARTLPVMAAPVIIGSVLAWQQGSPFNWGLFILTLVGAMAAHLGANVINDVFDFGAGTDQAAQAITHQGSTIATGSRYLLNGKFTITYYRILAVACFAIALLCGIILTIFRPWALLLGIIGFLLAFFYVAPPIRLAYIGRGLGEIDILISFGVLPLVGSFYIQSGTITYIALLASLPIGLYTMVVLYFHHFLHWRADKEVGKITPVVALGENRARLVGALLLLLDCSHSDSRCIVESISMVCHFCCINHHTCRDSITTCYRRSKILPQAYGFKFKRKPVVSAYYSGIITREWIYA